jgi:hypothetical protein
MPEAGSLLPPAPSRRGKTLYVAAAAIVVLFVGAFAYAGLRSKGGGSSSSVSPTVASANAGGASDTAATISIFLSSDVPETTFRIDSEPPVPSPHAVRVRRDEAAHVILATAPGYEPARHELRFDADLSWKPALKPKIADRTGAPSATAASTSRGRLTPPSVAAPHASTAEGKPPVPTPALPTTPRPETSAPRRPVDEDNPYDRRPK